MNPFVKIKKWLNSLMPKPNKRPEMHKGLTKIKKQNTVKTIYILWLQGFENAPFLVKKCLDSWISMNPTWNIVQLDKNNLNEYISIQDIINGLDKKSVSNASTSDIIRISLLNKYGGLWVDATTYCTTPLDDWLDEYIQKGFFAFRFAELNGQKPDRPISSWFIYGNSDNYIINAWYRATIAYCSKTKILGNNKPESTKEKWKQGISEEHYFWFHYLFQELYETDTSFKIAWDAVPELFETGPHFLQRKGMLADVTDEMMIHIDHRKSPLYKLTYRYNASNYHNNCNLHYLLEPELCEMEIASSYYKVRDCYPNVRLIHIGKCGGTAILTFFKNQGIKLSEFHLKKPDIEENFRFIIWIRNPLHRFVSAFNHSYAIINTDTTNLDINNLTIYNSLAPGRIMYKMKHDHTFSKEYDDLINYFKTANNLAESLSSTNNELKEKALQLMSHPDEHIYKGIGWYLNDGELVRKHNDKILFVGKLEAMTDDLNKLSGLLDISLKNKTKIRENDSRFDKYLSPLAIKNLINHFQSSDYKAIDELRKKGWIDDATYHSYFLYEK
jgi:hypothetical protein